MATLSDADHRNLSATERQHVEAQAEGQPEEVTTRDAKDAAWAAHDQRQHGNGPGWSYTGGDPGLTLFTAALTAGAPLSFTTGGRYLDVGCCEADWLSHAHRSWPSVHLHGIDWRAPTVVDKGGWVERRQANGLDPSVFEPETFDGIVSLSAVEHFGLGHYAKDPIDRDGDTQIIANCWRWLKPGGWLYFDVPYDPTAYRVDGTMCRVYDDHALLTRLRCADTAGSRFSYAWRDVWRGFVEAKRPGALIDPPMAPVQPFHYVAMVFQKV